MLWGRAIVSAIIKYKSVENVSIAVTIVEATDYFFLLPKYIYCIDCFIPTFFLPRIRETPRGLQRYFENFHFYQN